MRTAKYQTTWSLAVEVAQSCKTVSQPDLSARSTYMKPFSDRKQQQLV